MASYTAFATAAGARPKPKRDGFEKTTLPKDLAN
jgi:hypothetical protein